MMNLKNNKTGFRRAIAMAVVILLAVAMVLPMALSFWP